MYHLKSLNTKSGITPTLDVSWIGEKQKYKFLYYILLGVILYDNNDFFFLWMFLQIYC